MKPRISIIIPVKNRSLVYATGRRLFLLPNTLQSIRWMTCKADEEVEILIIDFNSTDWPPAQWARHILSPLPCRVVQVDGPFSIGRGCNIGARHAKADRLWFLNSEMLVARNVMSAGNVALSAGMGFFPICWGFKDAEHTTGEWRIYGSGHCMMTREHFARFGPWDEFKTHGKSDEIMLSRFSKAGLAVREQLPLYYHQWHPNDLAWLNQEYPGEYDKDYERAKAALIGK